MRYKLNISLCNRIVEWEQDYRTIRHIASIESRDISKTGVNETILFPLFCLLLRRTLSMVMMLAREVMV